MATTGEYYELAMAAHEKTEYANAPNGWSNRQGHAAKPFFGWKIGSGFQAAYFTRSRGATGAAGTEQVVAIAGTQGMAGSDILADIKLAIGVMPRQASSAEKFFQSVIPSGTTPSDVIVVGHSLGGALAQVLGFWHGVRFVTFNAPGMMGQLGGSMLNLFKPQVLARTWKATWKTATGPTERGINLIVKTDVIGNYGPHVGTAVRLSATNSPLFRAHGGQRLENAIRNKMIGGQSLWDLDPFQVL
ncbi:unnamed protein product [Gemmata massiliana]|uniref:Fungal lipase-like domain-containing protein n=1 Tax=Gemmata massiliana TaxID=1210884 RepID=A0A6P2CW69_9BACT|nr:hypothetical protein [Gemmata massiliana]VTR91964.1 unnamed protein product [Gemmata massiliana]